jgi:hypothetical protein
MTAFSCTSATFELLTFLSVIVELGTSLFMPFSRPGIEPAGLDFGHGEELRDVLR